ncbi:hypothetical protein K438DRAFT_1870194 [Mycena galopus ATCC 62051]|nr:hypothetical protein K438DRAFT_1870194 [Mycena galopus ATCC 62051]
MPPQNPDVLSDLEDEPALFLNRVVLASPSTCNCTIQPGATIKVDPRFLIVRDDGDFYAANAQHRYLDPFVHLRTKLLQRLWELCCEPTQLRQLSTAEAAPVIEMVEEALPALDKNTRLWQNRDRGLDFHRLIQFLHLALKVVHRPRRDELFEKYSDVLPPSQRTNSSPIEPLGGDWHMPAASSYFAKLGPPPPVLSPSKPAASLRRSPPTDEPDPKRPRYGSLPTVASIVEPSSSTSSPLTARVVPKPLGSRREAPPIASSSASASRNRPTAPLTPTPSSSRTPRATPGKSFVTGPPGKQVTQVLSLSDSEDTSAQPPRKAARLPRSSRTPQSKLIVDYGSDDADGDPEDFVDEAPVTPRSKLIKRQRASEDDRSQDSDDGEPEVDTPEVNNIKPGLEPGLDENGKIVALPGAQGIYTVSWCDFPKSTQAIAHLPKDVRWQFDTRVITANHPERRVDPDQKKSKKTEATPIGYPWGPPPNTTISSGMSTSSHRGASKVPAYVERYAPLEQIPVHEVHNITMKLLANPGIACIPCILANKFCEFRGWNQPCTACSAAHATGCTFRATESELQLTLNEIDPWISLGAKRTWYLVVDMHMAFVRAMRAQREAVINSIEFRQKFIDFAYQIGDVTSICGSSALEARFKSDTDSTTELRAAVNKLVADLNDIDSNLLQRHDEAHVANFNPDRAAHGGRETSERPATPLPSHPMAQPGSRGPPGGDADGDVAMTQTGRPSVY